MARVHEEQGVLQSEDGEEQEKEHLVFSEKFQILGFISCISYLCYSNWLILIDCCIGLILLDCQNI